MKLKEVCQQTGLSRKTIRLYEEKGLLAPQKECRNGREYREYSPEDVHTLKTIALLRRAWFTMEEIRQMQESPETIQEIFPQYRQWLLQQKRDLDALISVADHIEIAAVEDVDQLGQALGQAAEHLPLSGWDITPKFRYLDELEEVRTMKQKNIEEKIQETSQKTLRQTALVMDQDRINNQAITFGQIQELEDGAWKKETTYVKKEETLPKGLRVLETAFFVIFLVGLGLFAVVYLSGISYGSSKEFPTIGYVALIAMGLGAAIYGIIRGYAAWKERQAWLRRMAQQDEEKAEKRRMEQESEK